jgi:hypothetical protein
LAAHPGCFVHLDARPQALNEQHISDFGELSKSAAHPGIQFGTGRHELGTSRSASKELAQASERDQFWLDHEAAQLASDQTAKEDAAAVGVSCQDFYQARKRLRVLGLLAPAPGRSKPSQKRCDLIASVHAIFKSDSAPPSESLGGAETS